ncbi:hypothetical protein [Pectobacterium brasiliense]|uniref:hypothetical protein n=1 Tax=Pectobacterium brasiliense TaxID=180957 RepID=UPI0001A43BA7|nr:hypothetical protein [Pectobacterium brasiliense]
MDKRWCEKQNAGEQGKGTYVQSFPAVGDENKNSKNRIFNKQAKIILGRILGKGF